MRRLIAFNSISLDGYFTGADNDLSWAHAGAEDPEFGAFVAENASGGGELLFGRVTYEMMASYWPTPMAAENDPAVAAGMNKASKIVFSRTLGKASWSNTRVIKDDIAGEVRRMKRQAGPGMAILGSGSIVAQLTQAGLIDEFQVVVIPVILGSGRTMFEGVTRRLDLHLTKSRTFRNGKVFLSYEPRE